MLTDRVGMGTAYYNPFVGGKTRTVGLRGERAEAHVHVMEGRLITYTVRVRRRHTHTHTRTHTGTDGDVPFCAVSAFF